MVTKSVGNDRLYTTLCQVLDSLRSEGPLSEKTLNPPVGSPDAIIQARSRALLHLYLKSRFGLISYNERAKYVTDGSQDGGVDAYYIDKQAKIIYILQSKFRATSGNFVTSNVTAGDLLRMDVKRILEGQKHSEDGRAYNASITGSLQADIRGLVDAGRYKRQVILLGNAGHLSASQLKRLVDGYPVEQYPYSRVYTDLLFPIVTGTYYNDPNLTIHLSLTNLRGEPHLDYDAKTKKQKTNIKLLFVPTSEMGRVMSVYRNSILKFNPRSYLELNRNSVNKEIESSIRDQVSNEFALFNNGITIVTDNTHISSDTARRGTAQLVLVNPQLVNGGQTAYTLARIYETCEKTKDFSIFRGKEVLVKLITFIGGSGSSVDSRSHLIAAISKASNAQTKVDEYDRRSNDSIQHELQRVLFEKHGLFYERKRGEFSDGIRDGYIEAATMVNREKLVRVSLACDFRANQARSSISKYAGEKELKDLLRISSVSKHVFGYEILHLLDIERRKRPKYRGDRYHIRQFGQALRYGQYAVVGACANYGRDKGLGEVDSLKAALDQWPKFETWAAELRSNRHYRLEESFDFISYYKGSTLNSDLQSFKFVF